MVRFAPRLLLAAGIGVALFLPAVATPPTTHYRWKDSSGIVHFGDTIPASALVDGYDVINDEGLVIRHVSRELTPAERRAAAAAAVKAAAAQREAQQRKMADTQLLAAYPTDRALERTQQAMLKQIRMDIATLESNLHSQEDSLSELLAHAADLEHSKQPIPPYVNQRIADQRKAVNEERDALAGRRADLANSEARFTTQLERYRALRAKSGATDDPGP